MKIATNLSSVLHEIGSLCRQYDERGLEPEEMVALLAHAEAARVYLWADLNRTEAPAPASSDGDRLLRAEEVADILNVTRKWVYANAADLPFTRKLTTGALRFSECGLQEYLELLT